MAALDWLILIACVIAAVGGYRLGFVTRVASWVGIPIGVGVAIWLLPGLLRDAEDATAMSRLGIVVIITLLGLLLGQMAGMIVGARISASVPPGNWRSLDQAFGAVAGIFGVVVAMWILLPSVAEVPGLASGQVRSSAIAEQIDEHAPKPPNAVETLQRLVGNDSFPRVFEGIEPSPDAAAPPEGVSVPSSVLERAIASTVKVEGEACRRTQNGSGFAVAPNLFVTNAHVVAGGEDTVVIGPDGDQHDATVVAFDSDRDLALLRTRRYAPPSLFLTEARVGEEGAVLGHPGGSDDIEVSPAVVSREVTALGRDLYDRRSTRREVLVLSAELEQGDSGSPLVNERGEAIGIAFAIAPDNESTAYALSVDELRAVLSQGSGRAVDTGPCLAS